MFRQFLCRLILAKAALATILLSAAAVGGEQVSLNQSLDEKGGMKPMDTEAMDYLKRILYTGKDVENWIQGIGTGYIGEKYDGEVGWVHGTASVKHGVDGSTSLYSYDASGARRMTQYADKACRINTYGDSFTHCDQVSDGETWQEILAAHLGEPVRNFGVSGFSVYQAFTRMKREEARTPAKYVIFNIYSDDHFRNLYGWASLFIGLQKPEVIRKALRRPTMPYVRVNPHTGEFVELANPCPTPESLFNLSHLDWVYNRLKDEFVLRIILARANILNKSPENSYAEIGLLAAEQGLAVRIDNEEILRNTIETLYTKAALFASTRIVDRVEEYAAVHGKKVLYVLSHVSAHVARTLKDGYRFDREFVDYLQKRGIPYVDLMEAHQRDFARFNGSIDEYLKRYYIGHYNPLGNHFCAFAIKDKVVGLMDPKPVTYGDR